MSKNKNNIISLSTADGNGRQIRYAQSEFNHPVLTDFYGYTKATWAICIEDRPKISEIITCGYPQAECTQNSYYISDWRVAMLSDGENEVDVRDLPSVQRSIAQNISLIIPLCVEHRGIISILYKSKH